MFKTIWIVVLTLIIISHDSHQVEVEQDSQTSIDTLDVKRHTKLMMYEVKHHIMYLYLTENAGIFEADVEKEMRILLDSSNIVLDSAFYYNKNQINQR